MAKLPPKIPNWPDFSNQKFVSPYMSSLTPAAPESNPSWVDEFLYFSSSRRSNHRRAVSDSVSFFEPSSEPVLELECGGGRRQRASTPPMQYANAACQDDNTEEYLHQFVKFDDDGEGERLVSSMFNNEEVSLALGAPALPPLAALAVSNPSTPSDLGSVEDENNKLANFPIGEATGNKLPKCEAYNEVDSSIKSESEGQQTLSPATAGIATPATSESERIVDPKRVKRILANRQSAQRSRVRKMHYISELERSVTTLQAEVSILSPRVAFFDHQRLILNVDNSALKQRIAALAQDKIFKDAHQEALKKEIERLRQVYEHQQSLKNNMDKAAAGDAANAASSSPAAPLSEPKACIENEEQQLMAAD
uniref:BZIP domain-containing protein n=1 Tax=Kalanchoe fedtschenkoi TaxID=63787 RepID=A0A7N0VCV8_KALFE